MPFNCIFYYSYFDIYHSGLAQSVPFFVPVYIVEISTVAPQILTALCRDGGTEGARGPKIWQTNQGADYVHHIATGTPISFPLPPSLLWVI